MSEQRTALRAIITHELVNILGAGDVSQDPLDQEMYAGDLSWMGRVWQSLDWPRTRPDYIVWPESVEEVSAVLRLANHYKIPVTPFCGGAGVQGGTIPLAGGIILDVKKLTSLSIDERNLTATVGTGLMGQELEWKLNEKGYTSSHVPQSSFCSGVGGFMAARSAGMLSTKYGKFDDMVQGMEVVLPDGRIIRTRAVPRSAAGPNLNQLFMGSEGTLGVITEATIAITPMPETRDYCCFVFKDLHSGIETARKIMRRGLRPAALRVADLTEGKLFYHMDGSLFVTCFDGFEDLVKLEIAEARKIGEAEGGQYLGTEPGIKWWENRYNIAYPRPDGLMNISKGRLYAGTVIDSAGSFDYLEAIHEAMGKAVSRFKGTMFAAHFSHWYRTGGMMYPYVFNQSIEDESELADIYFQIQDAAVKEILRLGGTINHHHGIGLTLSHYMKDEMGVGHEALQQIKKALDPNNIMNPGKMGFEL